MTLTAWIFVAFVALVLLGFSGFRHRKTLFRRKRTSETTSTRQCISQPVPVADKTSFKISFVPSTVEWSGSTSAPMPLKTLTYKQYECLEDARRGFKIIGVKPTERKKVQPNTSRAHSLKTVESLVGHGFLAAEGQNGYGITDHGLNALEVCAVRY